MNLKTYSSFVSALLLASSYAYADITLDNFNDPQDEVEDCSPGDSAVTGTTITVSNGSQRTLSVDLQSQNSANLCVSASVTGGLYALSNEVGAFGDGRVVWTNLPNLDLTFQDTITLVITDLDGEEPPGPPITVTLNTANGSASITQNVTNPNDGEDIVLTFDFSGENIDASQVTGIELSVGASQNAGASGGIDMALDRLEAVGPGPCPFNPELPADSPNCVANPPECVSKTFSGVPDANPLPTGSTFATAITIENGPANSLNFSDSMSSALAVDSFGTPPSGCSFSGDAGDSSFSVSCSGLAENQSLVFNYTTQVTADFADGTLSNSVTELCGTPDGGSEVCAGSGGLCSASISRTPPPVPGITFYGLITSLIGLPMIAGFFASRRRA